MACCVDHTLGVIPTQRQVADGSRHGHKKRTTLPDEYGAGVRLLVTLTTRVMSEPHHLPRSKSEWGKVRSELARR